MKQENVELVKHTAVALSVMTVVATLVDMLPSIAALFTIVWTGSDEDSATPEIEGTGIFASRFSLVGDPGTIESFRVNDETETDQNGPTVAVNADGEMIVAWVSDHNGLVDPLDPEKSVFARWFAADGSPVGDTEFLVIENVKDAQ